MESGPAMLAGTAFTAFGAGLLLWTGVRIRQRAPIADSVSPVASAILAVVSAAVFLGLGLWCFSLI